jgi:hypothetical protein
MAATSAGFGMLAAPCGKGYIVSRCSEREGMINKRQFVCDFAASAATVRLRSSSTYQPGG